LWLAGAAAVTSLISIVASEILIAAAILATKHPEIARTLDKYRAAQTRQVLDNPDPRDAS